MASKRRSGRSKPASVADIVKAHKNYVNAINSNNTSRVMACYDKDAVVMQPNGPEVSGHGPIRKWVDDYFTAFKTHWIKKSKVMWVAGDYGFDQGVDTAADKPRDGGPIQRYTVKGILIYKRQRNGEFKVYRDIWNNNSAPTATYTS
jgi:ketosteroid isomerase-like protein